MRPWHWVAIDCAAGALAGESGVLTAAHDVVTLPSRLLLAAVIFAPVALRRRYPLPAFCALVAVAVAATMIGWARPAAPSFCYLNAAFVLYTVAVSRRRLIGVVALAIALTPILVTVVLVQAHQIPADRGGRLDTIAAGFVLVIAWMTGDSIRQRRRYAQLLQHEAASSAVATERLRIARELHDVVAHSMSVIAVQAGYGQYVIDRSPAGAREALAAIQATSRDALDEMRRMLGVLRPQEPSPSAAPRTPAPGLDDLGPLLQRASGAGLEVTLERSGRIRAVPAVTGLSAYRIIQEALTNVVRHAGSGARCTVRLSYGDRDLEVEVADDGGRALVPASGPGHASSPGPAAGSGLGLAGLRERAHLCGGGFTAGPRPDGGFQVTASLPLPAGSAEAS